MKKKKMKKKRGRCKRVQYLGKNRWWRCALNLSGWEMVHWGGVFFLNPAI
jgi:hypothetical protein